MPEPESSRGPRPVDPGAAPGNRRRWKRWLTTALLGLALVAVLRWWTHPLRGLPDVGDPFDLAGFERLEVPDEVNAVVLYREAAEAVTRAPVSEVPADWALADEPTRTWLEANRAALDLWRRGTDRPDAQLLRLSEYRFGREVIPHRRELIALADLALLEGSRLERAGDPAAAWAWHRALLRFSRHVGRRGTTTERVLGAYFHHQAADRIVTWASDPLVDANLLRRALADVREAESLTSPPSAILKFDYTTMMADLRDPRFLALSGRTLMMNLGEPMTGPVATIGPASVAWDDVRHSGASRRLKGEPELSRRLARLAFANWLAYCDRPPEDRPPLIGGSVRLFRAGSDAPPAARAVSPSRFEAACADSLYFQMLFNRYDDLLDLSPEANSPYARERADRRRMIDALTEQVRRREASAPPDD